MAEFIKSTRSSEAHALQEWHSQPSDQERSHYISVPHGMCVCTSAGHFISAWMQDGLHAGLIRKGFRPQ